MNQIIKSRFIFGEARHLLEGAGFVISTTEPFEIGIVLIFTRQEDYQNNLVNNTYPVAAVSRYKILIQYAGSLQFGTRMQVSDTSRKEIDALLGDMVEFYINEKIEPKKGHYNKYLV